MNHHISYAVDLMSDVCSLTVKQSYLSDLRAAMRVNGVAAAVRHHDSDKLIDWLVEAVSYQGVSDALAFRYMDEHGRPSAATIRGELSSGPSCPRLASFLHVHGCNFAKAARTCAEPNHIDGCPLPSHDLRNGRLNQIAFALVLFVRDVCDGDLIAWIDRRLEQVDRSTCWDATLELSSALLEPLAQTQGLSYKVLSMALSDLLLGASVGRNHWEEVGASMVAIDTLVHNWLARTGILDRLGANHAYGPGCYRPGMCADIISVCAKEIDARGLCPDGPQAFPRLIQHGIWRFCSEAGYGICNGNRIDDRVGCEQQDCPCFVKCERRIAKRMNLVPV